MTAMIPTRLDKCKGAMLATAIGDALGWPNEQRAKNKVKSTNVNDYFIEWTRRNSKPCYHDEKILPGEYSDDTQLTLSVARSIIAGNWEKFFIDKELPFWLRYERGGGGALLKAAKSCKQGVLPWQTNNTIDYFNAGGNGAVMRILPHIIANSREFNVANLLVEVIKDTIITHGHPRAVLGATCYAFALDYLLRKDSVLEYSELVSAVIDGQNVWGSYLGENEFRSWLEVAYHNCDFEYAAEWEFVRSNMVDSLDFIRNSLKKGLMLDDVTVLTQLGCFSKENGAGDVAILAAIYLASRYANNPALGIKIPAFSFGADTDTIASITGGLLGMLCGTNWIPPEWKLVQDYDCLIRIVDLLFVDNGKQIAKFNLLEKKKESGFWENTDIGRMRKVSSTNIQGGNYAIVTITKWESALGQTLFTKEMERITSQQVNVENQLSQQTTLFDKNTAIKHIDVPTIKSEYTSIANLKGTRQFVLNSDNIILLQNDKRFNKNITIGKILKIVRALIEENSTSDTIANQFHVELAMVELVKSYLT